MAIGRIVWTDLTVADAPRVRDFYAAVIGWDTGEVDMGGYADFNMIGEGEPVAGICHARGVNEGLPPAWLIYVEVEDLGTAIDKVEANGGQVLRKPTNVDGGDGSYAVIRDPAGAVMALWKSGSAL